MTSYVQRPKLPVHINKYNKNSQHAWGWFHTCVSVSCIKWCKNTVFHESFIFLAARKAECDSNQLVRVFWGSRMSCQDIWDTAVSVEVRQTVQHANPNTRAWLALRKTQKTQQIQILARHTSSRALPKGGATATPQHSACFTAHARHDSARLFCWSYKSFWSSYKSHFRTVKRIGFEQPSNLLGLRPRATDTFLFKH